MARQGEDPSAFWDLIGSGLMPPYAPYAIGKHIGHGVQDDRMAAEAAKTASEIQQAKGLSRGWQLLKGSRLKALEEQATSRAGTSARNNRLSNVLARKGVFEEGELGALRQSARAGTHNKNAFRSGERAARSAEKERAAVKGARTTALGMGGAAAVGAGGGYAAGRASAHKEASAGRLLHADDPRVKEAFGGGFGAALTAGVKGIGQFASAAAPRLMTAAQKGGAGGLMTAAKRVGSQGLQQAGKFISANPMAGAALVAAPAAVAGYGASKMTQ
jgi:hypothetical protein